ncbi:uncharacterized protein LOC114528479 [Dendronephthya gigantea]|uniref:uncharacterized protein LOC114528479 n=1 Tax=Dendronephthya gigantea TaxID=151771 RepID=UPI00106B2055|nr:uncharacterized protein LOC114528479 [Dendronephthya gigantea]
MKLLIISSLFLVVSFSVAFPRKHKKDDYERRRIIHHHSAKRADKHEVKHEGKHDSPKGKDKNHNTKTEERHEVYKKFGMFAAPSFALEDSSDLGAGREQSSLQQVLVPVSSASLTQNTATLPQMVSAFTAPSQRATLGTEVVGDQSSTQEATTQTLQPQQVQLLQPQQPQQPQTVQYQGGTIGTNEDNSVPKTITQDGASTQQETLSSAQPALLSNPAGALDAGSQGIQTFAQPADSGKDLDQMKDLQVYNGPLPDSGQSKPQIAGVSPHEEIKVVNLGDDEKTANLQQDKQCGGCPAGAKCVNGQCMIREEDAQAAGLTGKGSATNPAGSISDIHNLETQELTSLLKDASSADTPPTAVPEGTPEPTMTTESPSQGQLGDQTQTTGISGSPQQQKVSTSPKFTHLIDPMSSQQVAKKPEIDAQPATAFAQHDATFAQPHFTGEQLKELRDFARMYKMYQFIRKMEERLNDPDCAPICRKECKSFCLPKCCRGQKVNTSVVSNLMQTADKIKGRMSHGSRVAKQPSQIDGNGVENEDSEEQEEKKMDNDAAGKKHILIRILNHNDKPRTLINKENRL